MGAADIVWGFAYQGFKNLCKFFSLTTGVVTDPPLDTIDLSGVPGLWILGSL